MFLGSPSSLLHTPGICGKYLASPSRGPPKVHGRNLEVSGSPKVKCSELGGLEPGGLGGGGGLEWSEPGGVGGALKWSEPGGLDGGP